MSLDPKPFGLGLVYQFPGVMLKGNIFWELVGCDRSAGRLDCGAPNALEATGMLQLAKHLNLVRLLLGDPQWWYVLFVSLQIHQTGVPSKEDGRPGPGGRFLRMTPGSPCWAVRLSVFPSGGAGTPTGIAAEHGFPSTLARASKCGWWKNGCGSSLFEGARFGFKGKPNRTRSQFWESLLPKIQIKHPEAVELFQQMSPWSLHFPCTHWSCFFVCLRKSTPWPHPTPFSPEPDSSSAGVRFRGKQVPPEPPARPEILESEGTPAVAPEAQ